MNKSKRPGKLVFVVGLCALAGALGGSSAIASAAAPGLTVSPQPGTPDASASTQVSFLGPPASQLGTITVVGTRSGRHTGRLLPYSGDRGGSFVPDKKFVAGEQVRVRLDAKRGGFAGTLNYTFTVARPGGLRLGKATVGTRRGAQSFVSRPDLHPIPISVTRPAPGAGQGSIFIAPIEIPGSKGPMVGQYGPMILDNQGNIVWIQPVHHAQLALNFRAQTYAGAPVLTWWQGLISFIGVGMGANTILDSSYRPIATVRAGNGYGADIHEFVITPQGTGLISVYTPVKADLSSVRGPRNGTLLDSIVQEIDIKTGLVMYEWHFFGHVPLNEAQVAPGKGPFDAYHINSIQADAGGNLLLCARHTWAVYQVIKSSGAVAWQVGGKRSTFKLGPGVRFAWQHDAQIRPDGSLSLFDDEAAPKAGSQSRGIVIKLDFRHRKATLARQYVHRRSLLAGSQGNMQTLPNGNVFLGWGAEPYFTEYNATGRQLLDGHIAAPGESYRAYEAPWTGRPTDAPSAGIRAGKGDRVVVYGSWNGATEVATWQVLAGPDPSRLVLIGAAPRRGFETALHVRASGPYFAVRALDARGQVLGSSRTLKR